jgi:hypothetical protein
MCWCGDILRTSTGVNTWRTLNMCGYNLYFISHPSFIPYSYRSASIGFNAAALRAG